MECGLDTIKELLPHRDPFLFVDAIDSADSEKIIGHRKFTEKDFFFAGHFPQYPVVPGVILIETMAQCGGAGLGLAGSVPRNALFFLASVNNVKFRRQVRPGDEVRMEITNLRVSSHMIKQSGIAFVGDEPAAQAEWMCMVQTQSSN